MASLGRKSKSKRRRIACPHCERDLEVTSRTMSIFCPHCRRRVILEDFKIETYHASRDFVTAGDVTVEKRGTLSAPLRLGSLTVKGRVWGPVQARRRIHIKRTGLIKGDLVSPALVVEEGGVVVGHCRIGA